MIPMATTEEESSNEPLKEGWVPANHLEKKLISGKYKCISCLFLIGQNQCSKLS